jgi:O-antigen/teichoic acid export membrane protein
MVELSSAKNAMSLKAKAATAAKWTAISATISGLIQVTQLAILARLLSPSDFGLVATVMLVLGFAQIYLDMGISNAIIQRQDTSKEQLSSLYWLNIFAGWVVFAVTVAFTPLIVSLYKEPHLLTILPVAALLFLVGPPGTQFSLLLQKRLRFRTLAFVDIAASSSNALVAIAAATLHFGPLSLVLGQLFGAAISTLILISIGWRASRPMLRIRRKDIKGYAGFGLFQLGERTINFLGSRADQLAIGILLGPAALGYYSLAWNLIIQPVNRINPILTRVAFPLFSQVQHDNDRLKRGYLSLLNVLTAINAPILLGCAATAPALIPTIYGSQWTPSIVLVQILAGVGLLRSIINPIGVLQIAKGRVDMGFFWNLSGVIFEIVGVPLGAYLGGVLGVAVALLLILVGSYVALYWFIVRRLIGPCLKLFLKNTLTPVLYAALMAILVLLLPIGLIASAPVLLVCQVVFGAIVYVLFIKLFQPSLAAELTGLIREGRRPPPRY